MTMKNLGDAASQCRGHGGPLTVGLGCIIVVTALLTCFWRAEAADRNEVQRATYRVTLGNCTDRDAPGGLFDPGERPTPS